MYKKVSELSKTKDYYEFKRTMLACNIKRSVSLAMAIIMFEILISTIDLLSAFLKIGDGFHHIQYLFMYLLMIFANVLILVFAKKNANLKGKSDVEINKLHNYIIAYIIFVLLWGSVITLIDQKLYGQVTVFIVNMVAGSIIFYVESKEMLVAYSLPVLLLFFGMPFFQSSSNLLIGNYVNVAVFIILSFISSRVLFLSFYKSFKSNKQLAKEIENNRLINIKLERANMELKELSLVDELTKIPNRRSFNSFINFICNYNLKRNSIVSIIMIDIDHFKQYNDRFGHAFGDDIIKAVAQKINSSVRYSSDFVARLGGDEFVFISVDTNAETIYKIAERIRNGALNLRIPCEATGEDIVISLSLGTATAIVNSKDDIYMCLDKADQALYLAKTGGRNEVRQIS